MMRPHQNLEAWKKSFSLVSFLYRTTASFPADERFGLISQIRRAAVSVPTNIAEGAARRSPKEFLQFLHISLGSVSELDTLLLLSADLKFISNESLSELLQKLEIVSKLLTGLIGKLKRDIHPA